MTGRKYWLPVEQIGREPAHTTCTALQISAAEVQGLIPKLVIRGCGQAGGCKVRGPWELPV